MLHWFIRIPEFTVFNVFLFHLGKSSFTDRPASIQFRRSPPSDICNVAKNHASYIFIIKEFTFSNDIFAAEVCPFLFAISWESQLLLLSYRDSVACAAREYFISRDWINLKKVLYLFNCTYNICWRIKYGFIKESLVTTFICLFMKVISRVCLNHNDIFSV